MLSSDLVRQYGMQSLELAPTAATPRYIRLAVRFDQPPDLASYLDLKPRLSALLRVDAL